MLQGAIQLALAVAINIVPAFAASATAFSMVLTGFMPCKPRFVSGVKRHVSESIKLNPGKPRLVGGELHMVFSKKPSY